MRNSGTVRVRARITLLTPERGGRSTPFFQHYRPNHVFEKAENGLPLRAHVGQIELEQDSDKVYPGETVEVSILFLEDPFLSAYLIPGRKWWLNEGARCIGEAELVSV